MVTIVVRNVLFFLGNDTNNDVLDDEEDNRDYHSNDDVEW
jgi:hypothetical protein